MAFNHIDKSVYSDVIVVKTQEEGKFKKIMKWLFS